MQKAEQGVSSWPVHFFMPSLRQFLGLAGDAQVRVLGDKLKRLLRTQDERQGRMEQEVKKLRQSVERLSSSGAALGGACAGTMSGALKRLHQQGYEVETIIDIGASDGQWTRLAMEWHPRCHYVLVEAQPCHEAALSEFASGRSNVSVVMAAAGAAKGEIHFDAADPFGGRASEKVTSAHDIVVPVTTVDAIMAEKGLGGPVLIKFDTHGFETPILQGAHETLKHTSVIIMECYNFRIAPECLLFYEMCSHLAQHGFRPVEMVDVVHRERDGALWQMDVVFARQERAEFKHGGYR